MPWLQGLTVMKVDREGGGGGPSHQGGVLMDFIMFVVFAHLAIVLDPKLDFTYAIFYSFFLPPLPQQSEA